MIKTNRFSDNLKKLLDVNGEKQVDFAKKMLVTSSLVSQWKSGNKKPDADMINRIARHFNISVEMLMYGDFSEMEPIIYPSSKMKYQDFAVKLYPFVTSAEAEKDMCFAKGYALHCRLWDTLRGKVQMSEYDPQEMIYYYERSLMENGTIEAACNLVGCYLMGWNCCANPEIWERIERLPDDSPLMSSLVQRISREEILLCTEEEHRIRKEYLDECRPNLLKCLRQMKRSSEWADLADFYLAALYLYGMVDNEHSAAENRIIGSEMLYSFALLGNRHAEDFIIAREVLMSND